MNNNIVASTPTLSPLDRLDIILDNKVNMSPNTKYRYRRALKRAVAPTEEEKANGAKIINVMDPQEAAAYGNNLTTSNRSFFRAALRLLGDQLALDIKTAVTPDTVLQSQAALMRIEAMTSGIEKVESKGTKAHTWLTRAQVVTLLSSPDTSTLKGKRDYIVLALAVGAGLRRNEIVNLKWDSLVTQGERVTLQVLGKGRKNRVVPLNASLVAALNAWRAIVGADGFIVRSISKGGALGDSLSGVGVLDIVSKHGKSVGMVERREVYDRASKQRRKKDIGTLQPHDLRRTYAQIGYDSGVPIAQISTLLGHANTATTEKYLNIKLDMNETISDFIPFNGTAKW